MSNLNMWRPSRRYREPAELMQPIVEPAGWYPQDMKGEQWIYRLSEDETAEVLDAVAATEAHGLALKDITRDNFPLPRLGKQLLEIRDELMEGRGFALIRGLPVEGRSRAQTAAAFWGIGAHIGRAVSQNKHGHLLGHVKDLGGDYTKVKVRGYMTKAAMGFHADSADILSLCCLSPAKAGGEHRICSSVTLYNEMLKSRPDLVKELTARFYRVRKEGDILPGETDPWVRQPVLSVQDGYFAARGLDGEILKAQQLPGVPKLTEAQQEAIRMFNETAPRIALDIDFERGDISYVMNHVMLHSRTDFEDWPEPERKRHLLRLWLATGIRPVHPDIARALRGIAVEGEEDPTPLEAV
jgi:hypothetical protein